jgi:hypothetical protein
MGIIDTLKDVATLVQKTDNIELTKEIIALQTGVVAMLDENRTLRERVLALESALDLKGKMQFDRDAYWMGEGRAEKDGPYCPRCYDHDGKTIRMLLGFNDVFRCPECKTSAKISGIRPLRSDAPVSVRVTRG